MRLVRGLWPCPGRVFFVRIAYLDESGTPELTGNTTHFVLVALVIPGDTWKEKDQDISALSTGSAWRNMRRSTPPG